MGVGAGLYMYVVVVQKFTFAISSPDEFLLVKTRVNRLSVIRVLMWNFMSRSDSVEIKLVTDRRRRLSYR